ncbi:MAG: hypothetical protein Rubg2KO_15320 [Rubricoccaceae bacterium]
MASLYTLDTELAELSALLSDADGAADDDTLERYDALLDAREDKLDAYVAVIRNFESDAHAFGEESKRLHGLHRQANANAARLRQRLLASMQRNDETELTGRLGKAKVQTRTSRAVVVLADPESLPDRFRRVKIEPDKVALKAALEQQDPDAVQLAEIETRTSTSIRIS